MSPTLRAEDMPFEVQKQLEYVYPQFKARRPNKFQSKSQRCLNPDHALHQSRLEAGVCNSIYASKVPYRTQFRVEISVAGRHICNHYMDFAIFRKRSDALARVRPIKFIEAKGAETPEWILKSRLVRALFPNIEYEIVK